MRRVSDSYEQRILVGETWPREQKDLADYLRPDELQLAFNFRFLLARYDAGRFRAAIEQTEKSFGAGAWPTWTLSNHDFSRHISRYSRDGDGDARARVAAVMLLTLRGTPFIYYGEEIGMRDAEIPAGQQTRSGRARRMPLADAMVGRAQRRILDERYDVAAVRRLQDGQRRAPDERSELDAGAA